MLKPTLLESAEAFVEMVDRWETELADYPMGSKEHGLRVCLNNHPGELLRDAIAKARGEKSDEKD